MSHESFLAYGTNKREIELIREVKLTGLSAYQSPTIYCDCPVENKHGRLTKLDTNPDLVIINEILGAFVYIEVTNGSGETSDKNAQMRVVHAANVKNYFVVTKIEIKKLQTLTNPVDKLNYFYQMFGWDDLQ